ncbi:MAG TPA: DUF2505 family protein, partial [Polyangiaceae bacterium]
MPSFRLEHDFECSQNTYWERVFFDEEYNRRLFHDELHFPEWRELEKKDEGSRVLRHVRALPPLTDLPATLKAVIGDGAGYEERGVYDRKTQRYEAKVTPNRLADRVTVTISMSSEELGEHRCRRVVVGSVTARILMVGALLEQRMIADLSRSYAKSAEFTNRFLSEKGWT